MIILIKKELAGGPGFEPGLTGPEPVVLPLDDPPVCCDLLITEYLFLSQEILVYGIAFGGVRFRSFRSFGSFDGYDRFLLFVSVERR